MADVGLVPTAELEAVLMTPLSALLRHGVLFHLIEDEQNQRVMGVGSVLLQLLAIQMELGEPLKVKGDLLVDLRDRAITPCPTDGAKALEAMFGAIRVPSGKAAVWFKRMMEFNRDHTIYDAQFRLPTFRRDDPSFSAPTEAIPVIVKRPGELKIEGERPKKRATVGTLGNQLKVQTPGHSRSPSRLQILAVIYPDAYTLQLRCEDYRFFEADYRAVLLVSEASLREWEQMRGKTTGSRPSGL
ncbi:hypothetical protein B0H17DRAFT_1210257 [Mycena rosella]|uniref:Uncharacterized protein n=1 Tax=Mycena rosella TaxID=1033263 RepID=A0AAD7G7M7_MYCRO|nr:hypothetical protein B0H17DRAFT_1210257 [Mycena rosella]